MMMKNQLMKLLNGGNGWKRMETDVFLDFLITKGKVM
jgi:hypothetical protein